LFNKLFIIVYDGCCMSSSRTSRLAPNPHHPLQEAAPKVVAKKYAAPVTPVMPGSVTVDDLDDLVADLERQERRRIPPSGGLQVVGARKTTTRRQVKGALDGDDLERIVAE